MLIVPVFTGGGVGAGGADVIGLQIWYRVLLLVVVVAAVVVSRWL